MWNGCRAHATVAQRSKGRPRREMPTGNHRTARIAARFSHAGAAHFEPKWRRPRGGRPDDSREASVRSPRTRCRRGCDSGRRSISQGWRTPSRQSQHGPHFTTAKRGRRMNPPVGVATRVPTHHRDLRTLAPAGTNPQASPSGAEQGERTILVAEDDHSCRSALLQYFERSGYRVTEAADGPSTLRAVFQHSASLVILDLGLPGFDGTDVLAKIRRHSAVPVIVCSGRDSEDDRIRTLNLGADDFVVKPFSFAELEARVRAVLRRGNGEQAATCLHLGELVVDRDTRTVTVRDKAVPMTRKEFDLLGIPGRITRTGVLPRGPPRAGLGFDRGMAGPVHCDRARPPGPSQDRTRPGFASLDHHCSWRWLQIHTARRRLKRRRRRRGTVPAHAHHRACTTDAQFLVQKSYAAGHDFCRH